MTSKFQRSRTDSDGWSNLSALSNYYSTSLQADIAFWYEVSHVSNPASTLNKTTATYPASNHDIEHITMHIEHITMHRIIHTE